MAFFVTLVDGTQLECDDEDRFSIGEHSGVQHLLPGRSL